ncbi:MAG TPA: cysteine hydrolase [Hyphomicrobiales bacterium]|nr:cysteine hydrolase [Hyphomicrobiales bacterium]
MLDPLDLKASTTALIVVDMQNDFVREGAPLEVPDARATIDAHRRLLDRFRGEGRPVVFTRFIAGPKRTLIWNWSEVLAPPVCCCWPGFMRHFPDVQGERDGAAVIDELAPLPGELQLDKYNYGAFHRTGLLDHLLAAGVDTVVVTGTVTQICVDETARGAFREGLKTVMVSDAVSSFDPALHQATLANFAMKFGWVMSADEVLAAL